MADTKLNIKEFLDKDEQKDLLRFLTAGSVDDGKSTLIGRLLFDSKKIYEDQLDALERELHKRGLLCRILDGDNIRSGINNNLGFSPEDRVENIRRIAEVGKLFVDTGVITIAAFISPNNELREMASAIIGKADFLEVYVSTPLAECERRDVKGLYAKARKGEIKEFTGVSAPFEAPERPDLSLDTSVLSVEQSVSRLLELIIPKVEIKH